MSKKTVSLIIPCYNEEKNISFACDQISKVCNKLHKKYKFEAFFIDDGSTDNTVLEITQLMKAHPNICLLELSRNFGKEIATTAGINHCTGDCAIIIDADMQYPVEKIPEFLQKWEDGGEVIVGVRDKKKTNNLIEIIGSNLFYAISNKISNINIQKGALDFRLIDRKVINEFNKFTERGRMTRALIDWLGFQRDYVYYQEKPRQFGQASYNFIKRCSLAFNTIIVTSLVPLRLAGLLGLFISASSLIFGLIVVVNKYIIQNEWGTTITGSASVGIFNLFLTGVMLISLGLIALYIEFIHVETLNRPLYVIRNDSTQKNRQQRKSLPGKSSE